MFLVKFYKPSFYKKGKTKYFRCSKCKARVPACRTRVGARVSGGERPAVLQQRLSRHSPPTCSVSAMAQQDKVSKEQVCLLCRRAEADPDICGVKRVKFRLCVHIYCQFFASGLFPQENSEDFFVRDTRRVIQEAAKKHCFACSKMGATITCWKTGCDRSFHLPCAPQGECVTQFFGLYRSFCWEHRPRQAVQACPGQNNTCSICLDTVEDKTSFKTMVCPACQDARFHRHCIQRLALHAGVCFRCPCCQNQEPFLVEMLTMGIRISKRPPSWESDPAVEALDQRQSRCDTATCLCPGGRKHTEEEGPWELLLCSSCAAEGTHRHCSSLESSTSSWECKGCAGTETGSTGNSELVKPSTSSQAAPGLGHASSSLSRHPGPAQIEHGTQRPWQAQNSGSPTVKCPKINRVPLLSAETSSPSTSSQAVSQKALPVNSSSCFPRPRQSLKRQRPEQDNESWTPGSPPAKRRRMDEEPAQSAEGSRPSTSSQAPWLYRGIWAASRAASQLLLLYRPSWLFPSSVRENRSQPGPVRMRHISRQRRRARKPYSLPRNHRRTRRAPARRAGPPHPPQKHRKKRK